MSMPVLDSVKLKPHGKPYAASCQYTFGILCRTVRYLNVTYMTYPHSILFFFGSQIDPQISKSMRKSSKNLCAT